MQRITIGRYNPIPEDVPRPADPLLVPMQDVYAGWIEGVRDDGTGWIMWLDKAGNPEVFWPDRDEDGGVRGEPIMVGGTPLDPIPVENQTPWQG